MNEAKFKKFKRVAAWIGIVILIGMYIVSLVAALCKSEIAKSVFTLSMYCTFVIPVIIYLMQLIYKVIAGKNEKTEMKRTEEETKNSKKGNKGQ